MSRSMTIDLDMLEKTAYTCETYLMDRWEEMVPGILAEGFNAIPFSDLAHDAEQRVAREIDHIAAVRMLKGMITARVSTLDCGEND